MRKVILQVAVSLDGFIEGPNGEYDWCLTDQDYGMADFMNRIDAIFYGRKSYEMMLKADPSLANTFTSKKSYIFSNTLKKAYEGTELISGNIIDAVNDLKSKPGKDLWLFGGASLTTTFINAGLIDEISLAVHPILLGKGKLLFNDIDGRKKLKLISSTPYSSGLVMLNYEVVKS